VKISYHTDFKANGNDYTARDHKLKFDVGLFKAHHLH